MSDSAAPLNDQTQLGFPGLAGVGNPVRFALARAWLQRCDSHGCRQPKLVQAFPTNLLDVSNPNTLRLVTGNLDTRRYLALSHCWGKPAQSLGEGESPPYCTTVANFNDRQKGFSETELPQTFRDAIEVARGLRVQYLWIDSLCIKQGAGGNWKTESQRMQDIYALAYCTVAATSAVDSYSGFLKRTVNTNSEYLYVRDDAGRTVYVCNDLANFDADVDGAPLNTRAWVIQERFLSPRTIHFAASQMYWECGKGVYCEDFTQLTSLPGSSKYFKLDPQFPDLLLHSGYGETLRFLEYLLTDYSKRTLTESTDRAVAMSGLTDRIKRALPCEECYGIFNVYLHRNLLWRRQQCDVTMTRIHYSSKKLPSWSWMAYTGGIKFIDDSFGSLEVYEHLKFAEDRNILIADLWEIRDCRFREHEESESATRRTLIALSGTESGTEIGWIKYDISDGQVLRLDEITVVGRSIEAEGSDCRKYYVLILRREVRGE